MDEKFVVSVNNAQLLSAGAALFEHVLYDGRALAHSTTQQWPATAEQLIESLGQLHTRPLSLPSNVLLDNVEYAIQELRQLREAVSPKPVTIVDLSGSHSVKDADKLFRISESSGVPIVMTAGLDVAAMHPTSVSALEAKDIAAQFIDELVIGTVISFISNSGQPQKRIVRAGALMLGFSQGLPAAEQTVLRAVGIAQLATKCPLILKPSLGTSVLDVSLAISMLLEDNIQPNKIILTNTTWLSQLEFQTFQSWLRLGINVCISPLGTRLCLAEAPFSVISDDNALQILTGLLQNGFGDQVCVSSGVCFRTMLKKYGGFGYSHVIENTASRLLQTPYSSVNFSGIWGNAMRWLSWWSPPAPVVIEPVTWRCDFCHKECTDRTTQYSKFEHTYCSMKCLSAHRKHLSGVKS